MLAHGRLKLLYHRDRIQWETAPFLRINTLEISNKLRTTALLFIGICQSLEEFPCTFRDALLEVSVGIHSGQEVRTEPAETAAAVRTSHLVAA